MNIAQAKQIKIESVMRAIGAEEKRATQDRKEIWFLSPMAGRNEKTASFKIDTVKNTWYDHGGVGEGGDVIKLVQRHLGGMGLKSVSEALQWLDRFGSANLPEKQIKPHQPQNLPKEATSEPKEGAFKLVKEKFITNRSLIAYISDRGIPPALVRTYASEIYAKSNKGTSIFGIGIKNDLGGWEVRGAVGGLKVPVESKAITTFYTRQPQQTIDTVNIIEGQFDFYTMAFLFGDRPNEAAIILNGAKLWKQGIDRIKNDPKLADVKNIKTWTQHDNTGRQLLNLLTDELQADYTIMDMSEHYKTVTLDERTGEILRDKDGQEVVFNGINEWWQEYKKTTLSWPKWAPPQQQRPDYEKTTWKPVEHTYGRGY